MTIDWDTARQRVHEAGARAALVPLRQKLPETDGTTLAEPLIALTPLPSFPTSSVDGYAVRGAGPWRLVGRVLAGQVAGTLDDGTAVEVATGAMVPEGVEAIVRLENATVDDDKVDGTARPTPEWRRVGEECAEGEELLASGTAVTPAIIGMAAAAGHDELTVRAKPRVATLVFGDELTTVGVPAAGRVRDSLGPQLPSLIRRCGGVPVPGFSPRGPIEDTLDSHVSVLRAALDDADIVCTTGGTMHGPVDHLHAALRELGAEYVVDTVAVRPGYPMLVAALPGDRFVAGLPGNPQSAVIAFASLVVPLVRAMSGRTPTELGTVRLSADVPGRGDHTHLVLVRRDTDGTAHPLPHTASSMLRGLAAADGFAVVEPGRTGRVGDSVRFLPVPSAP